VKARAAGPRPDCDMRNRGVMVGVNLLESIAPDPGLRHSKSRPSVILADFQKRKTRAEGLSHPLKAHFEGRCRKGGGCRSSFAHAVPTQKVGSDLWTDTCPPNSTASVVDRDSGKMQDPAGKAEGYREKQCVELARSVSLAFPVKSIKKSLFGTCSWRRICRDGRSQLGRWFDLQC
jgi:hypothetical protein